MVSDIPVLVLFCCGFFFVFVSFVKINVFMNSQNVLVIIIRWLKDKLALGKKIQMPSILQSCSPSTENGGPMSWNQTYFYETKHHKTWVSLRLHHSGTKINRHAESICFTLAQLNKYIFSQNQSKILAIARCLKSKTVCFQIPQWESGEEENLGL